jgi:hypothetical protein
LVATYLQYATATFIVTIGAAWFRMTLLAVESVEEVKALNCLSFRFQRSEPASALLRVSWLQWLLTLFFLGCR